MAPGEGRALAAQLPAALAARPNVVAVRVPRRQVDAGPLAVASAGRDGAGCAASRSLPGGHGSSRSTTNRTGTRRRSGDPIGRPLRGDGRAGPTSGARSERWRAEKRRGRAPPRKHYPTWVGFAGTLWPIPRFSTAPRTVSAGQATKTSGQARAATELRSTRITWAGAHVIPESTLEVYPTIRWGLKWRTLATPATPAQTPPQLVRSRAMPPPRSPPEALRSTVAPRPFWKGLTSPSGPSTRLGIVGPNGVGKTTLLRILAGSRSARRRTSHACPPERRPSATLPKSARRSRLRRSPATWRGEPASPRRRLPSSGPRRRWPEREPGADEDYGAALERYLALGGPDLDARAGAVLRRPRPRAGPARPRDVPALRGPAARAALAALLLVALRHRAAGRAHQRPRLRRSRPARGVPRAAAGAGWSSCRTTARSSSAS